MSLLDQHWDAIHSVGNDDLEEWLAPLAGLNGVGGEGTIIQAIRLTPLIPGAKFGQYSLWDFQLSQRANETERSQELRQVATEAGVAAMGAHLEELNGCIAAFEALVKLLAERCGAEAPPSSNTLNVLQEAAAAVRSLAGIEARQPSEDLSSMPEAAVNHTDTKATPSYSRSLGAETIGSREEAFEILAAVSRYFRRTEPHSPISMSIDTIVRRGRMDFSELLTELLPESQHRNAVLTAAGIQPRIEKAG